MSAVLPDNMTIYRGTDVLYECEAGSVHVVTTHNANLNLFSYSVRIDGRIFRQNYCCDDVRNVRRAFAEALERIGAIV